MTNRRLINLVPEQEYRRTSYGIPLVSETQHYFAGRGIHNPHHRHQLSVWDNSRRHGGDSGKKFIDPQGQPTNEHYSFLWSAQASVITAHPGMRDNPEMGYTLELGDIVVLAIHGYVIGEFQVRARPHYDPHLVRVDTASSASRQHYIETGDYLTPEEAQEASS